MDPANGAATVAIWIGRITLGCQCHIRVHFDNSMDFLFSQPFFEDPDVFLCVQWPWTCSLATSAREGS